MRIEERHSGVTVAVPRAVKALEALGATPTFHEGHGARHPLAAYRISLSEVVGKLLAVVDALALVQASGRRPGEDASCDRHLLDATDHMLDALMEHIGDCNSVLRSLFALGDSRYRRVYDRFKNSVRPYREHIGAADNYLKHNQGRLVLMSFEWGASSSFGYYIEGPLGSGTGPATAVHGEAGTAFSFNRDIPFHVCHVYAISDRLAAAIEGAGFSQDSAEPHDSDKEASQQLARLLSEVAKLPRVWFPDELRKPAPLVQLDEEGVLIEYPSDRTGRIGPPYGARVTTVLSGDGVTRSFKLPYLGRGGS